MAFVRHIVPFREREVKVDDGGREACAVLERSPSRSPLRRDR